MKKYGEFEILNEAGSGGCGEVFVAKKTNDVVKKAYILKTIRKLIIVHLLYFIYIL